MWTPAGGLDFAAMVTSPLMGVMLNGPPTLNNINYIQFKKTTVDKSVREKFAEFLKVNVVHVQNTSESCISKYILYTQSNGNFSLYY